MELEIFVHGAMCVSYSGRCYLSAWRNRKSANEGNCTHPCRWEYVLHESTRPEDPLILEEDERYSYLLSSKDLCLLEHLPDILATGVSSLKVEGRMKSSYYAAVVTRAYRQALDKLLREKEKYRFDPQWIEELKTISHRGYTTGFAFAEEKFWKPVRKSKIFKPMNRWEWSWPVIRLKDGYSLKYVIIWRQATNWRSCCRRVATF